MNTANNTTRNAALTKMGLIFKNNAWRTIDGHKKFEAQTKIVKAK